MHATMRVTALTTAVVLFAGLAAAQAVQPQIERQYEPLLKQADKLIGTDVKNHEGENLGKLEEVVLENNLNYVAYGVLARDDKYFAIPWNAFQLAANEEDLQLNIPLDILDRTEGFDKDQWPETAGEQWRALAAARPQQEQVYGRPVREQQTNAMQRPKVARGDIEMRRVTNLLKMDVKSIPEDEQLGELEDVVLDFHQGLVAYGVVSLEGDQKAAVPWSAIELRPQDRIALIETDREKLEEIAFSGEMPNLSDSQYAQRMHTQFNRQPYWEVLGFVGEQPQTSQMQQADPLSRHFDPQQVTIITGTIQEVGSFDDAALGITGQRLHVRTHDGQTVIVHAGPSSFLERQGLKLETDKRVQLQGSYAEMAGRRIFIASEIRTPDAGVWLRDQKGMPQWSAEDMQ